MLTLPFNGKSRISHLSLTARRLMKNGSKPLSAENRWRTLVGVMDFVEAQNGQTRFTDDDDRRPDCADGDFFLLVDKARLMAWFQCVGERWMLQFTICDCCPAIHLWEPFYLETPGVRVGKAMDDDFPGIEEAIRVARAWVLDRQMKDLARS